VSLARHGPVQQREGDGRARRVLEGLVLWPDGLPPIVEIDQKPAVLLVDAARNERFQDVATQRNPGLLSDRRIHHRWASAGSEEGRRHLSTMRVWSAGRALPKLIVRRPCDQESRRP